MAAHGFHVIGGEPLEDTSPLAFPALGRIDDKNAVGPDALKLLFHVLPGPFDQGKHHDDTADTDDDPAQGEHRTELVGAQALKSQLQCFEDGYSGRHDITVSCSRSH